VAASGGAWNASIVAEDFRLKDKTYTTVGLGATISRATDAEPGSAIGTIARG